MMRRCAVPMFDQGRFSVMVTILDYTLYDCISCLCLTKVGSTSMSQSKIKHCMTVFCVLSISFEPLKGFTNHFAQMSAMMVRCAVPMFDQCLSLTKVG